MALVLLATLPAFGLLLYDGHRHSKQAVQAARHEADTLVHRVWMDYNRVVAGTRDSLRVLAHVSEHHRQNPAECSALFADLLQSYPYYANLGAVRPDGVVVCSATPVKGVVNASDRAYFRNAVATRDFSFGDYQIGRITGKPVLVSSYPSYNSTGNLQSVVFAALDLSLINQIAAGASLPEGFTVSLLDSRGTILNRHPEPEKWIGKSRADTALARAMLATRESGTVEDTGLDGVRRLYTYAPLFDSGQGGRIYVVAGIPRDAIAADVRHNVIRGATTLSAVTILALMIAWFGGDYFLLRKIRVLADSARRLARGEHARTGIADTRGEIGLLARTFDDMADAIETRTDEIRRANDALRDSEERFRSLVETTSDCIWEVDARGVYTYASPKIRDLLGYAPEEVLGKTPFDFMPPDEAARLGRQFAEIAAAQKSFERLENVSLHKDGHQVVLETSGVPILDGEGRLAGYRGVDRDVTERIQTEEELHRATHHDALTGLPNRVLLFDRLQQSLIDAKRRNRVVAVLWLDVDNFKNVNDSLGIENGDRIIRAMGERLQTCVRAGDTVARVGGDEFCVVLKDLAHEDNVVEIIQKILSSLSAPHRVANQEFSLSTTVGVSLFPRDALEPEGLLENVDAAMYHAKERGDSYQFYSPNMTAIATERLALENDLRHALEQRELFLHYQPQVDLHTGLITGVEALLRWRHPRHGMVSPAKFIPLAESTNLILPIGEWVLREACAQARAWQDAGLPSLRMGVNLSVRQFRQPDLAETVRRILEETKLDPRRLDIELTESTMVQDPESVAKILTGLETLGVQISIDDFGTGYSSLSYLKRLPIDILKIDQSFVRGVTSDLDDASIVIAIITLAHALGIQTIAEGVETREQAQFLRKHGCEAMQGFFFSKPAEADAVAALLGRQMRQSERERVLEWFER